MYPLPLSIPDINGTICTYYTAQVEPVILLSLRVMFAYFKVTSVESVSERRKSAKTRERKSTGRYEKKCANTPRAI